MLEHEFHQLLHQIEVRKCEEKTLEIKAAHKECPDRLYDTFSSFSNQDDGGVLLFGIDEKQNFDKVGVYDAQDLQKKLMEVGETMTPVVRPVLTVFNIGDRSFVTAEIPPVDLTDRPCFKTAKGRLKGSYIRVGDADKPMTEYEIYSYEAFRKQTRDDIRPVDGISMQSLDQIAIEKYLLRRKMDRPNLAVLPQEQLYELTGIVRKGEIPLSTVLLFCPYPQAYFPQLSIIASCVPGTEIGELNAEGQRFSDSKRIEGTLQEMLDGAVAFVRNNMRTAVKIDPATGKRQDISEYPLDAVREAILNALVHRDYSIYTENMPIQLLMFSNRLEVRNPGGLYGRITVDELGQKQPDTRNPFLVTMMEALGQTENRYSGIPCIRQAMKEMELPPPIFDDMRGEFSVCLYNGREIDYESDNPTLKQLPEDVIDEKGLLSFCTTPRSRKEIIEFLNLSSVQYAVRRYLTPMIQQNAIQLLNPEHPRSRSQMYQTNPEFLNK